jgi:hypothetical protein
MIFNGTNEIKQLNLIYKVGKLMTSLEPLIPFKFILNSISESRLPFMSGKQEYV